MHRYTTSVVGLSTLVALGEPSLQEDLAAIRKVEKERIAVANRIQHMAVTMGISDQQKQGIGSGVIMEPDGYVLTNFHVIQSDLLKMKGRAGTAGLKSYPYEIVGFDPDGDLAIVKLKGKGPFPYARFARMDTINAGDPCLAVGNSFAMNEKYYPTVTLGSISAMRRTLSGEGPYGTNMRYANALQIDASINGGNSGGALFNLRGEIMGINGALTPEERGKINVGAGYTIPVDQCLNFLPALYSARCVRHGSLDASFVNQDGAVRCDQIDQASLVYRLGLRLGDELVSFDGHSFKYSNDFNAYLAKMPEDWPVELTYARNGVKRQIWFRLPAAPYPKLESKRPGQEFSFVPGEIFNERRNRQEAYRVIDKFQSQLGGDDAWKNIAGMKESGTTYDDQGKVTSSYVMLGGLDGKFQKQVLLAKTGKKIRHLWDGETYQRLENGKVITKLTGKEAAQISQVANWNAFASILSKQYKKKFDEIVLEGSGRTQGQPCYRIKVTDEYGNAIRFWFSMVDSEGGYQTVLLKLQNLADASDKAMLFDHYQEIEGRYWPQARFGIKDLAEKVMRRTRVDQVKWLSAIIQDDLSADKAWEAVDQQGEVPQPTHSNRGKHKKNHPYAEVRADIEKRLVNIYGMGVGLSRGYATGMFVSDDGLILTIRGAFTMVGKNEISAVTHDGKEYPAKLVRVDDRLGLALLKIEAKTPNHFQVKNQAIGQLGDTVLSVSNLHQLAVPGEEPMSVQVGIYGGRDRIPTERWRQDYQIKSEVILLDSITSNSGCPGGALVSTRGELMGILGKQMDSKMTNTKLNYAIPVDVIYQLLHQKKGKANEPEVVTKPGYVGIQLFGIAGNRAPAFIGKVMRGSPAKKAGLRKDDLILSVNGQSVANIMECQKILQVLPAGIQAQFTVKRGQRVIPIQLTPIANHKNK